MAYLRSRTGDNRNRRPDSPIALGDETRAKALGDQRATGGARPPVAGEEAPLVIAEKGLGTG
jgi:hypothetical protein